MKSAAFALLGAIAAVGPSPSLAQRDPIVTAEPGRLHEALLIRDSLRRAERFSLWTQMENEWPAARPWMFDALNGVASAEQLRLMMERTTGERLPSSARPLSVLPVTRPDIIPPPTSIVIERTAFVIPESDLTESSSPSSDEGYAELYSLDHRLAHYQTATLETLAAEMIPEEEMLTQRLELLDRRDRLERRLGTTASSLQPASELNPRIQTLQKELHLWAQLAGSNESTNSRTIREVRRTAREELDRLRTATSALRTSNGSIGVSHFPEEN